MLIGLVGPDFAGKEQVIEFLVKFHGFKTMSLGHGLKGKSREPGVEEGLKFGSATEALDFVMERWREHYVLTGIEKVSDWKVLKKRPFFLLVSVDAPVSERFLRYKASTGHEYPAMSLKEFVVMDDVKVYGRPYEYPESGDTHEERTRLGGALSLNETQESKNPSSLHSIQASAHVHLLNRSPSPEAFIQFLSTVDLVNHERLRPSWDMYFMKLCDLAASRSNCMHTFVILLL